MPRWRGSCWRRAAPISPSTRRRSCRRRGSARSRRDGRRATTARWRDRDPATAPAGAKPAIRLKAPREGETVVPDLVQGEVRVANAELDDMIILRSDGTPTYLHAVVVDDHDMGITHVIRGDDHLTNTFRQCAIYDAMGWRRPHFAHVPLIHGRGRGQALQAARRGRRAGIQGAGLPAGGAVQLPAAARLGAWRRGGGAARARDRAVRPQGCGAQREPHGLREAPAPERRVPARGRGWAPRA